MYSFQGAPIENNGYNDVPINNQFSNSETIRRPVKTNQYEVNRKVGVTMNKNNGEYIVYQDPTVPSPSLSLETDVPMSGYYYQDPMSLSLDGDVPLIKKKEQSKIYNYINSDEHPPFGIEKFHGGGGHSGGGHSGGGSMGGRGGGSSMGGRGGGSSIGGRGGHRGHGGWDYGGNYGGSYGGGYYGYPVYYDDPYYLNTQIMPNVSGDYWNYAYTQPTIVPVVQPVIQKIYQTEQPSEQPSEEVRIENLQNDVKTIIEEDKKSKKKVKRVKKENTLSNRTLWGIILLLVIIIILFMFKIFYK